MKRIGPMITGSLRLRLVLSVALVHALMMALFVWDLVERQEDLLLKRRDDQGEALVLALASAAGVSMATADLAGLQELVDAKRRYPDLAYALLCDRDGRILAHTDRSHIAEYLLDLPAEPRHTVISRNSILLDIGTPVHLADSFLGWARVGIGPGRTQAERAAIARSGLGYALAAITLGSVIAWILARGITARLERIRTLAQDIRVGRRDQRAPDLGGDEIGDLGRGINAMLDDLNAREAELADARDALALALADLQETQQALLHNERLATIGTMAAGIAHELNNPLMGVLNYVAFAQSRASDPKSAEVLAKASRGLGHIRQVVMGLLGFARASPQSAGPVDLVALVGQALELVGAELSKRDIAVVESLPVDLPLAWGDPDGLRQVLVNLFINARDALEGCDPKRLDIRAQAGVRTVWLEVQDSGPGIPQELRGRIFDAFFTTKPPGQGTGLGLSVSASIVKGLGGCLSCEPCAVGALFRCELPLAEGPRGASGRTASGPRVGPHGSLDLGNPEAPI